MRWPLGLPPESLLAWLYGYGVFGLALCSVGLCVIAATFECPVHERRLLRLLLAVSTNACRAIYSPRDLTVLLEREALIRRIPRARGTPPRVEHRADSWFTRS